MKVRIKESCLAAGQHQEAGSVVNLPDSEAALLLRSNRAVRFGESAEPAAIETREPEVEQRDPKPLRKKSAKA